MINENLHKKVVALDRVKHRDLKLDLGMRDLGTVSALNALKHFEQATHAQRHLSRVA